MKIIGCDFHPGYQQIAVLDLATREMVEKALSHPFLGRPQPWQTYKKRERICLASAVSSHGFGDITSERI